MTRPEPPISADETVATATGSAPAVAVGIGVRPGTSAHRIVSAIRKVLGDFTIGCLATIDRRAAEPGVRAAAAELGVPIRAFAAHELAAVATPTPAERTRTAVGTASVAEAAAVSAAAAPLVLTKRIVDGITIAAAVIDDDTLLDAGLTGTPTRPVPNPKRPNRPAE
ncbi:cobalamin biosynthesis protein [Nocardia sp. NPDC050710]|uniref:cobalamin biosynthesis protein n=1 Tax=Nocardia sp. NPDC050710 TaxID=3157220 RepID=UPI0033E43DA8